MCAIYYVAAFLLCHFVGVILAFQDMFNSMDQVEFRTVYNPLHLENLTSYLSMTTGIGLIAIYLMAGRTTFVIAHRLSTIRRANQILGGRERPDRGTWHTRRTGCCERAISRPTFAPTGGREPVPFTRGEGEAAKAPAGPPILPRYEIREPLNAGNLWSSGSIRSRFFLNRYSRCGCVNSSYRRLDSLVPGRRFGYHSLI